MPTTLELIGGLIAALPRLVRTPDPPLGYGTDLVCGNDLDPQLRETDLNSAESMGQDLFHRMNTVRGTVADDPDFGVDVGGLLSKGMTQEQIARGSATVAAELRKDDRVDDVAVDLTESLSTGALTVTVRVSPADPALTPFALIVAVTDGAALLTAIQGAPTA